MSVRCFFRALAVVVFLSGVFSAGMGRADLVGHWKFDGDILDSSAFGNHGNTNTAVFSGDVPVELGMGQSLNFNGAQSVLVPDSNSLDITGAITIAAWVKPAGVAWEGILAKSPSDGSGANHAGNYEFRIENGTRALTFHHQRGGLNDTIAFASSGVTANNVWQHVAVTLVNSSSLNFYINGNPAGTLAHPGNFGAVNSNQLYIGTRADLFTGMNGNLDDVRLYNEALSPAAIAALAAAPPPEPPYPMLPGVLARASTEFTGDGRLAAHVVNGNGLAGRRHVQNPPGGTMWLTNGADASPTLELDLGGVHDLSSLRVWNYNENATPTCCLDRGANLVDVFAAGQDGVYGPTPILTRNFARAPGTLTDFSELAALAGNARYLKLAVRTNHGDPSFTGLSEVKVTGDPVVGLAPIPATIKSVSSNLAGFNRNATYTVDRSGMLFADRHSTTPDGGMWLSQGSFTSGAADLDPEISFDLGSVQTLSHMKVWNYNEYRPDLPLRINELLGRGVLLANILVAGEDMVFRMLIEGQEFERAPEDPGTIDFGQLVDLQGAQARFVKIDILFNHNGKNFLDPASDDGLLNFAGLSEVQFFAPVPEPSSYAVALLALAGVAAWRRRK